MMQSLCARALALALAAATPGLAQAPATTEEPRAAGTEVPVPKRSKFVQPEYPAAALAQGLRGLVILALTLDTTGTAARQWEYEVTRVEGRAVPVRLTVPITFALKLPEVSREQGIPELRQGVSPPFPAAPSDRARETNTVEADLTIDPAGQVVEAEITSGESPWSEALLQALRTWRFTPTGGERSLAFRVRADFVSAGRGAPRVDLKLSGPRHVEEWPAAAAQPAEPPPSTDAAVPATPVAPAAPAAESPTPEPQASVSTEGAPAAEQPAASQPAAGPPAAAPPGASSGTQSGAEDPPAPTVEVIPPAPRPVEPGVSAVQDVTLGAGVPDLSKGRRPVTPPLARMSSVSGNVEVRFVVEASGASSVRDVTGPELLKEAARQTVASWMFRRTTPERLPLLAVFAYMGDGATASVRVVAE
jgi:outer membrane biosynthesis protein TonB